MVGPAAMLPRGRREETVAIATINPATGETVKTYDEMSEPDVERCLAAAAWRIHPARSAKLVRR